MVLLEQIEALLIEHPEKRFYVHNGFHSFGYGFPCNPTLISPETALQLLNRITVKESVNILSDVQRTLPPLQYTEQGAKLYECTGQNRFIVFVEEAKCIIEKKRKARKEHAFDIRGAA